MHLADWVPTLLGLAGVQPPTGEIFLSILLDTKTLLILIMLVLMEMVIVDDNEFGNPQAWMEWTSGLQSKRRRKSLRTSLSFTILTGTPSIILGR